MTKVIKMGALSAVACAMLSTTAFAGTFATTKAYTAAKEISDISTLTFNVGTRLLAVDADIKGYIPADIPLANLANPAFTITPSAGKLSIDAAAITAIATASSAANAGNFTSSDGKLAIVESTTGTLATGDKVIAVYTNESAGVLAFAGNGSVQVSNGKQYILAVVDSALAIGSSVNLTAASINAAEATDALVSLKEVAKGTTAVSHTIKLGAADTQTVRDTATGSLLTMAAAVTASIKTTDVLNETIDAIKGGRKAFKASATDDIVKVSFVGAALDDSNKWAATDTATLVLKASKALPSDMGVTVTNSTAATSNCTISTDGTTVTCPAMAVGLAASGAAGTKTLDVTFTPNAAKDLIILDAKFTADVAYNFNDTDLNDYTSANLLASSLSAGQWKYNGYNITVPYIHNTSDISTFVKLVNKNAVEGIVYADIQDDAGNKCSGIELTNLPANKAVVYNDTAMMAAATAAGCSVSYPFSIDMIATVNPNSVEAVASQRMGANGQRVLPVYTNRNSVIGADLSLIHI